MDVILERIVGSLVRVQNVQAVHVVQTFTIPPKLE